MIEVDEASRAGLAPGGCWVYTSSRLACPCSFREPGYPEVSRSSQPSRRSGSLGLLGRLSERSGTYREHFSVTTGLTGCPGDHYAGLGQGEAAVRCTPALH